MNTQFLENKSSIQPKKGSQRNVNIFNMQKQYVGQLHPLTKKRHGKGNYQYKNKFFQYDGTYVDGKKQGLGTLKMNDGTVIEANFVNDEITGKGKITYPDGSFYDGQFSFGQRQGKGLFESIFERYEGHWKQNSKEGSGKLQILSTGQVIEGQFHHNKPHGKARLKSYNYHYEGDWNLGKKQGYGEQKNQWRRVSQQQSIQEQKLKNQSQQKRKNYDSYEYKGSFLNNAFHGQGKYCSKVSNYIYEGQFVDGLPKSNYFFHQDYPNQFRVFISFNVRDQSGQINQTQKSLLIQGSVFQYELEGDSKNIYVQCVYQGPQYLDENQPTQQEIDQLIKNWQNQNKKNKNPPPMPDFRAPKMKKPQLTLITEESHRQLQFILEKQGPNENDNRMKIDYRSEILQKRAEIEKIKQEQKKNQDQDPKKKGSKKETKNQNQFKINLFNPQPKRKEKNFKIETINGSCCFKDFELPDDFPQGRYFLIIKSDFQDFGRLKPRKIEILIKSKQPAGKKK